LDTGVRRLPVSGSLGRTDGLSGGDGIRWLDGGSATNEDVTHFAEDNPKDDDVDLLFGGFVSLDDHVHALDQIIGGRNSTRDYEERDDNLRNGTGPILGGTGSRLAASGVNRTVFDDGDKDDLKGEKGRDWFFADLDDLDSDDDRLRDKKSDELVDNLFDLP
jgi:hypothetical protein